MTFQCRHCGVVWPADPRLSVPCPKCMARVGVRCAYQRPSGHRVVFGMQPHVEREQAAMDADYLRRCVNAPPSENVPRPRATG